MELTENKIGGFTLIEMLVVVSSLALLTVVGSNLFFGSLFGSKKTESIKEVRQNGEYALKVIEETIKNSYGLQNCDDLNEQVVIKDKDNQLITFKSILDTNNVSRIASVSGDLITGTTYYLTNDKIRVENFQIDCDFVSEYLPSTVTINFDVVGGNASDPPEKKASLHFTTSVSPRNF